MTEWKKVILKDCLSKIIDNRGKTPKDITQNGHPLIEVNAISSISRTPKYSVIRKYVDDYIFNNWFRSGHPHIGDVLVPTVGTLGCVSLMDRNDCCIAQNVIALRANPQICDSSFLYYILRNNNVRRRLLKLDIGGVQPSIKVPHLIQLEICIPSLDIQQKIASILSSLDSKIECNRKICANLEAQAQALFKNWFVDFAPFKNGKFVESELGMIPEGWRVGTLGETGIVVCGKTPSKTNKDYYGGDIPFVKIPDMHNNIFVLKTEDSLSNIGSDSQPQKLIPAYSIMVSCIATIGLVSINIRPSHTNQQINSIIPKDSSYLFYLYEILNNMKKHLQYMGRGGTTLLNVNTKSFSNIKIIIPSNDSLFRFHEIISGIFSRIEVNAKENLRLATLRDTLLPKLMSGEIKI